MNEAIRILKEEIIKNYKMKLEYEAIHLKALEEKKENVQVVLMISHYDHNIAELNKAIKILNEAERN